MAAINNSGDAPKGKPLSKLIEAASKIDGIDIGLALGRIGGKQNVLVAAIEQTVNSIDEKMRKMEACISDGDLRSLSIEAHGLKNAFVGIGAVRLSALATEMEAAAKAGNMPLCTDMFALFKSMASELTGELKSVFHKGKTEKKPDGDAALFSRVLAETAGLLKDFEADDALNCMRKLDAYTYGDDADALLNHIKGKIKAYKYDEAIRLLKSLMM